jgi:hypothetical protein
MNTMIVEQRKAAKGRQKCKFRHGDYPLNFSVIIDREVSSGEEYVNEDAEDESDEDAEPQNRRSSAAKRKSIAILSKDKTESWENYRNTIDNGPVPRKYYSKIYFFCISFL